ncbi:MAG: hypothetical protein EXX96DRAFT_565265 [Benjaminiella poitrasii]|nr:MAG: hypothetical protein EXX96DRAFT_565265 [Benjaminiella poitrasii]
MFDTSQQHHFIHDFMMNNNHNNEQGQQQQQQHVNPNQYVAISSTTITPSIISSSNSNSNTNDTKLPFGGYYKPSTTPNTNNRRKSSSASATSSSAIAAATTATSTDNSPPYTTPSPPIYYPSIPEEEEDDHEGIETPYRTDLILQGANNAAIIKPMIQKYLEDFQGERKITILTSRVAQKSYGTEKRFLCPPPYTILSGESWFTTSPTTTRPLAPSIIVHITGEKTSQNGVIEWRQHNNALMDSTLATLLDDAEKMKDITGNCVSRNLHINDADEKRKRVEVLVKIGLGHGGLLGTFPSKGIKVISKPSKKRQSVKNMELCIHHGTTIALFNRIRSQTVSTKYLGVSSSTTLKSTDQQDASTGRNACFVARTSSWDPFIIWIVDTTRSPDLPQSPLPHHPDNPQFPAPPAIAIQYTKSPQQHQPIALHYNQPVVLQCVTTGLVSPVMIVRRIDKGSWIVGGNRLDDLRGETGGECGDEAIGDPVSQLHKVAFQIVHDPSIAHHNKTQIHPFFNSPTEWTLPQVAQPVTYLACLDNVVGMHKTTIERRIVMPRPARPPPQQQTVTATTATTISSNNTPLWSEMDGHEGGGKMVRKRRVSYDVTTTPTTTHLMKGSGRRRVNSLTMDPIGGNRDVGRRLSSSDRRGSLSSADSYMANGSCWTEDVSDASVWTIVGTDRAQYKFWTPPGHSSSMLDLNSPFSTAIAHPISPFPVLTTMQLNQEVMSQLIIHGEGFTRDISVWFGDIKSLRTDFKSREIISCLVPDVHELIESRTTVVEQQEQQEEVVHKVPLLFVRSDGVVYNTDRYYSF